MGEVPLDGFANAGFESFGGFPAEFTVDFGGIDRVAAVMAGAVGDIGDLRGIGRAIGSRREIVEHRTKCVDYLKVGFFIPAADVVGFANLPVLKDATNGGAVVLHIEPIADLLAIAVDGKWFAGEGIVDDQRDEFFREMIGAVIIRAIGGEHR